MAFSQQKTTVGHPTGVLTLWRSVNKTQQSDKKQVCLPHGVQSTKDNSRSTNRCAYLMAFRQQKVTVGYPTGVLTSWRSDNKRKQLVIQQVCLPSGVQSTKNNSRTSNRCAYPMAFSQQKTTIGYPTGMLTSWRSDNKRKQLVIQQVCLPYGIQTTKGNSRISNRRAYLMAFSQQKETVGHPTGVPT